MGKTFWDALNSSTSTTPSKGMGEAEKSAALQEMAEDRKNYDDKTFNAEDIAAGGYNALNSALFGIPDVVVKAADSDAYKKLQALRERNKTASTVGDIAGALLPTPTLTAKGVSLGAKALSTGLKAGKAADVAGTVARGAGAAADFLNAEGAYKNVGKLKDVAQGALRGGVESGLQVAPRLASGETDGKTAGASLLMGAGIGGASAALPSILKASKMMEGKNNIAKPLEDELIDKQLAARNIDGQAFSKSLKNYAGKLGVDKVGYVGQNVTQAKRAALDFMKARDIHNADDMQNALEGIGSNFEEVNGLWNSSGLKVGDLTQQIFDDPMVKNFIEDHPKEGIQYVQELIDKYNKKGDLRTIKSSIDKDVRFSNMNSTDKLIADSGDVSYAIKDKVENAARELDPKYPEYKEEWKAASPLRYAVAKDKSTITKFTAGAPTAARLMASNAISGGVGAGGLALTGFDPNDQSTWTPAALKAIGGLVVGSTLNRLAPGVANYAIGTLAGVLDHPQLYKTLQKAGYAVEKANIPAIIERLQAQALTEETPEQTREKMGEIQDPETVAATKEKFIIDNGMTPETADAAVEKTQQYGQGYMDRLNKGMKKYWEQNFSDQMAFEDYVSQIADMTNGFDPKESAAYLFDNKKDYDKYILDLDVTKRISGVDLNEMYGKPGIIENLPFIGQSGEEKAVKEKQQSDLVDTIASLVTDPGNVPTKQATDTIKADIGAITKLDATPKEKRDMLIDLLSRKYNLGYNDISKMGLV